MIDFIRKHTLIFGTLFLTATGFLSRILGFFYRIFLSRTIGAEGLGIYQMIFPIYNIGFSLCAGSIQTAISRFAAADQTQAKKTLRTGFLISFSMSLLLAALIWSQADFIAVHILMEPRCAPLLPAMALAIPCTSIHACISGYYYGKEKVQVPAMSQLVEQCIRIFCVFLIADICKEQGREITVMIAVVGLVIGEAASALFTLLCFLLAQPRTEQVEDTVEGDGGRSGQEIPHPGQTCARQTFLSTAIPLMSLALPLMANRLIMNLLQSAEAILIPNRLSVYGLTQSQAVSIYGVLTGMAMPFIMFPSAIVNSMAVVLLPSVARHQSAGSHTDITNSISISFRYSLYMGILCIGIFTVFGDSLGLAVFQNEDAGSFITILAWLCPFLYLATTMGSILNGMGKTTSTFLHNLIAMLVRLGFVFFGIPHVGIKAVLWGMLGGEILLSLLHLASLERLVPYMPDVWDVIVKPVCCLVAAFGIYRLLPQSLPIASAVPPFIETALRIGFVCMGYGLMLLLLAPRTKRKSSVV